MNTKRIVRWSIVLLLLLALPGLTAALAQGEDTSDELSTASVPGAPASTSYFGPPTVYESEWNNTRQQADYITVGDVVEAVVDAGCAGDYFQFDMEVGGYVVIETNNIGGYVELLNAQGVKIAEAGAYTQLLYYTDWGTYYIHLNGYSSPYDCYPYVYKVALSSPLLISAAAANLTTGTLPGLSFKSADILAFARMNNGYERWEMLVDASDVNIKKNVTNIALGDGDNIFLTVAANQAIAGIGTATPWDIFRFDPDVLGYTDTHGDETFSMEWTGKTHQLTASGEKLDALTNSEYCAYISTTGTATVPFYMGYNIKFKDEDLGCWYQDTEWLYGFEGKKVPGLPVEDVIAAAYDEDSDQMYLTILGNATVLGHPVTQQDIFAINLSDYSWGGIVWHGPDYGWNYKIDAFEWNGW